MCKIAKKNSLKECIFVNLSKYTPTDCFFGDFAHWVKAFSVTCYLIIN